MLVHHRGMLHPKFWKNRRVLLTGHTGFKGAWMTLFLEKLGAMVFGVSLPPSTQPSLYEILAPWPRLVSYICDLREQEKLTEIIKTIDPEIVIHMAAQPLVRESYNSPVETIQTNVMGTVYLLEALRHSKKMLATLIITTDKVYLNSDCSSGLSESNPLGGADPYSASKAAVELITYSYAHSFFKALNKPLCTARAGNVVGGGDWAKDRLIPDLWRAHVNHQPIALRYPHAVRPWQHVFEPLYGYLVYLENMIMFPHRIPNALNFGPQAAQVLTVKELAKSFAETLKTEHLFTDEMEHQQIHEQIFLSIDASLAQKSIGWHSVLTVNTAIDWTCNWYAEYQNSQDMRSFSKRAISEYFELVKSHIENLKHQTPLLVHSSLH